MKKPSGRPPKRKRNKLQPHRVIRVLTEGAVTEPSYLSLWVRKNRNVKIDFKESGMAPLTLVHHAQKHQEASHRSKRRGLGSDFDEIWCVFDVDEHPHLNQAIQEADDLGINVALSNPCFELWLVLHEEDQTAFVERSDIQRRAKELKLVTKKALHNDSHKKLLAGYPAAKQRAEGLNIKHELDGSPVNHNPSSQVWKLVDQLL